MVLPLLIAAALTTWLLILSVIVALCQSASQGDLPHPENPVPAKRANPSINAQTKTWVTAQRSSGKPTDPGDPTRPAAQLEPSPAFLVSARHPHPAAGGCKNRPANVCITRSTAASTASLLECNTRSGREGTW